MYYMGYLFSKKLNNSAFSSLFTHTVPYLGYLVVLYEHLLTLLSRLCRAENFNDLVIIYFILLITFFAGYCESFNMFKLRSVYFSLLHFASF